MTEHDILDFSVDLFIHFGVPLSNSQLYVPYMMYFCHGMIPSTEH